jgi:polyisoprenoid-binding protein YceI
VKLTIHQFLCKPNPVTKKENCGADASASIDRSDFGVDAGKAAGFRMQTKLLISVEAAIQQ